MTSPSIFYIVVRPRSLKIRCFSCSFDIATEVEFINSFNTSPLIALYIFKGRYRLFFAYGKQLCEASLSVLVIPDRRGPVRPGGKVQASQQRLNWYHTGQSPRRDPRLF